jgi:hypothetical protein
MIFLAQVRKQDIDRKAELKSTDNSRDALLFDRRQCPPSRLTPPEGAN